ncbi:hypothetical protein L226DRAFT_548053 [Lentinus tigrinus ALCF2SS1-7]|uniref:uncharacterized protein n=1 Tax=Lentinus tigrinus ALCF2SS1-7 TaxID=1328758 RepID=UPI001165FF4E|nr:hypothetical protein L226DRAFT_548053 [Lentinus tigrinus ALCF2SS1-7]
MLLVSVGKVVLDAISPALNDLPSSDDPESRYHDSGLLALSDLCYRPLTVRFNGKRWSNHSSFTSEGMDRSGFPTSSTFTVHHYSGPVTYSAQGLLEKNLDALNPDFRVAASDAPAAHGSGSMNPLRPWIAHPRNEETIVSAQQPVKPMRAPSTHRKNTIKRMPTLGKGEIEEKDKEEEEPVTSGGPPCVAGEFKQALDLEGRSVKAQVLNVRLSQIARRCVNVYEARYGSLLASIGVTEGDPRSRVEQARIALGLHEREIVLGMSVDDLRSKDTEEQKRNRLCDAEAEAELDPRNLNDPYATSSNQALPLPWTNDPGPDWYFETMTMMRWSSRVGFMAYSSKQVAIYKSMVYDFTTYLKSPPSVATLPNNAVVPGNINTQFMHQSVIDLYRHNAGGDVTKQFDSLSIDSAILNRQRVCMRDIFLTGKLDTHNSPQCLFATSILLALSIMMVSVIGFKFIASINFSASRAPEAHNKFVICQVPCYTEGYNSLKKTIDSLAQMKYDDKPKLLFIICDGTVVGSGNDMLTPRIILEVLGTNPNVDAEPLSFLLLGEGAKQHNMSKAFSGLYEPPCGKPGEKARSGSVHFNAPMNPLELETYHQIKNVIGVNPTFYEYVCMVDADTTVAPLSLNRLVSA